MDDTTATAPPPQVVTYNVDGSILVEMNNGPLKLRRPAFGEIRTLIRKQGDVADRLQAISFAGTAHTNEALTAAKDRIDTGKDITAEDLPTLQKIRDDSRAYTEKMEEETEEALVEWWSVVFETLAPTVTPEQWPGFLLDSRLPARMVQHWRFVPTGPG